ncbi:uncharacterized protein Fot_25937 [Forsythia ovata]|uniref:Uncharacterized protein n=1 Tax=Forsythia ovata TaxID=205694 RepID=A0ABD1UAG2_9LAMI
MNALNKLQCTLEKQVNVNLVDLEMKREKDRKEFELREQVMKKEIELKEKAQKLRERAQRRQEQERIMNQDLSKLPPTVRASYEIFQGQILKEWEIEGLFGNDMNDMEQESSICQDGEEVEQSVPAQGGGTGQLSGGRKSISRTSRHSGAARASGGLKYP